MPPIERRQLPNFPLDSFIFLRKRSSDDPTAVTDLPAAIGANPAALAFAMTKERPDFHRDELRRRIDSMHIERRIVIEFKDKTTAPNQLWQTDFTYLKVIGWGWFYLSTILDDFSRYIIAWKLCTTMRAEDVTDTLNLALVASGCDRATVQQRPRLLSDNRPCYVASELADWLQDRDMRHTRGAPCHPQTQGKIERWHQTLKNRILLENYFLPGDLEEQIAAFVERYNHRRYHESLDNLNPADVYFGRGQTILLQRERIKRKTIELRRLQHRKAAA